MDILIYRYGSICEPDIIDTFKSMGNFVFEIKEEITNKNLTNKQCVEIVSNELMKKRYDFVFSINFYPVVSEVCKIFKTTYVSWMVDSPVLELYSWSIRNECNRIFMFDYAMYSEFINENPNCIYYLPLGANYERLESVINSISAADREKYSSDITFIGSTYSEKCSYNYWKDNDSYLRGYFDGIIEAQLKVYGYNFLEEVISDWMVEEFRKKFPFYEFAERSNKNYKAVLAQFYLGTKVTELERLRIFKKISEKFNFSLYTASDLSDLPKVINKGLAESLVEMPKIFHLSKINLNLTSKPIRTGLPQRVWDIMSAGGFLLSNYQEELPEYFEIGKDLDVYSSEDELIEKIEYYLNHEDERIKIAQNGYRKIKNMRYTLRDRLETMMSLI